LKVKEKILRNKFLIRSEIELLQALVLVSETSQDLNEYFLREYEKSSELHFINIDELPDDINELESEFLEGLFLITN
jgi:archaellum component FlaC